VSPISAAVRPPPRAALSRRRSHEWKLDQQDKALADTSKWRTDNQKEAEKQTVIRNAIEEFTGIEQSYKGQNPDYLNAISHARNKYADSIKTLYPKMTDSQINTAIDHEILKFASECSQKGLNPAEELYDMAIERFGYAKQAPKVEEPAKPEPKAEKRPDLKPDLRVVSNNKKRSATPLAGGGRGGSIPLTKEMADDLTLGEFSKLTPDQIAALEAM
jgi:hypothetical protein